MIASSRGRTGCRADATALQLQGNGGRPHRLFPARQVVRLGLVTSGGAASGRLTP
jgi:hypothetical protein